MKIKGDTGPSSVLLVQRAGLSMALQVDLASRGITTGAQGAEETSAYLGPVHFTNLRAPFTENSVGKVPPEVHTRWHPRGWSILYGGSCPVYVCPGKMLSVVK